MALTDFAEGAPVRRYNVVIGHTDRDVGARTSVNEDVPRMPALANLSALQIGIETGGPQPPLEGRIYFRGIPQC